MKSQRLLAGAALASALISSPVMAQGFFDNIIGNVVGGILSGETPEEIAKDAVGQEIQNKTGVNPQAAGQNFDTSRPASETYNNPNFTPMQNQMIRNQLDERTADMDSAQREALARHGLKPGDPIPEHLQMQIAREAADISANRYAARQGIATGMGGSSKADAALGAASTLANGGTIEDVAEDVATQAATEALTQSGIPGAGALGEVAGKGVKAVGGLLGGLFGGGGNSENAETNADEDNETASAAPKVQHTYPGSRRR